jgi:uncharacterized membrane protein YebE (DUF533 family)
MNALGLLGSLMGNNATGSNVGGQLISGLLGGSAGGLLGRGGSGGLLSAAAGSLLGGGARSRRGGTSGFGRNAIIGMLGSLAVSALTSYAKNKMSQSGPTAQAGLADFDDLPDNPGYDEDEANRRAEILIRAMINAAKADGHVDEQEQENILQRVGDVDQEQAEFLRREIAAPLDVQAFIRSVPRGMEQEVYTISLMGIQLDEQSEARYLIDLAQGLGLSADTCNNIHRELGAPEIFK